MSNILHPYCGWLVELIFTLQETLTQPPQSSTSAGQVTSLTAQTGLTSQDQEIVDVTRDTEQDGLDEGGPVASGVGSTSTGGEGQTSVIQQLFGSEVETLIECRCGWSTTARRTELLFSLFYQNNNSGDKFKVTPCCELSYTSILHWE